MIDIGYQKHQPTIKYRRNKLDCYLCSARKKLIVSTPEEAVRQAVLKYFIEVLQIPVGSIVAEVPMSYYAKGQKGRADIIVNDDQGNPLILVECKAPNQFLSDAVVEQAQRYDDIVKARVVMITNGIQSYAKERNSKQNWQELSTMPTYMDLLNANSLDYLVYEEVPYERTDFLNPIPDELLEECIDSGYIGEDTSPALYPLIFNLMGWLYDKDDKIFPSSLKHIHLVEDAGIRLAQFGNAGGGAFGTEYRYFIIKDKCQNNQIISVTIVGIMKAINDPQWGNRNGATILAVAIDDFKSSHMSLELRLDKYASLTPGMATIWHDGTLTVGKLGQVKRQAVIAYIADKAPQLLNEEGKIILGVLDLTQEIRSSQPQTKDFLDNLILYALLRDEYRQLHKAIVK